MKKVAHQILIILLVMIIGFMSVFITKVNAVTYGISVSSSITEGEKITVTLSTPADAVSASASITVTYSDGTTNSGKITYVNHEDMKSGSLSTTFPAKVAGTTKIEAKNIVVQAADRTKVENGSSDSKTVTIAKKQSETPNGGSTSVPPSTPNISNNTSTSNSGSNVSNSPANTSTSVTFQDINQTVYTTERCNVRKSYSTSSEKITLLDKNTTLKRTGIGSNGWSRIEYNGQTAYVSSTYLTTTKPNDTEEPENVEFKDVNEKVYAKQSCNLRKSWSTSSELVGYLDFGQEVIRTGIASNGWSRIKYNEKIVYVASRLVTTEKQEEETKIDENDIIEEPEETIELTEEQILAQIKEEVGVLPEVGTNIAVALYSILTIITGVVVVLFVCLKLKNTKIDR